MSADEHGVVDGVGFERHGDLSLPRVVFVPGMGFSRGYWGPVAERLRGRVCCLLVDNRDDGDFGVDAHADDVAAVVGHFGARVVCGHSFGANVALAVAARGVVDGCVLVSLALRPADIDAHLSTVKALQTLRATLTSELSSLLAQAPKPVAALWGTDNLRLTGRVREIDQRGMVSQLQRVVVVAGAKDLGDGDPWAMSSLPSFAPRDVRLLSHSLHHPPLEEAGATADVIAEFVGVGGVLRSDVVVDADNVVEDEATGHRFAVDDAAAVVVRAFGDGRDATDAVIAATDADREDAAAFVDDVRAHFSSLGLLREGLARTEIERRQRKSRAVARDVERFEQLKEALHRAYETVPFHRARFDAAGLHPRDVTSSRDLLRLPVMTKADLRKNFPEGLVPEGFDVKGKVARGELSIASTSGTSEERLQVLFDWSLGVLPERARELWNLDEDKLLSRGAVFTTPRCSGFECHLGSSTKEARTRSSTLTLNSSEDVMDLDDAAVRMTLRELTEHKADVLFVNPWYAAVLALRARALGIALPPPSVVLSSYQHLTHQHRALLRDAFSAPVFSYWGATDLGGALLGVGCHCGALHVREDHAWVEVVERGGDDGASDAGVGAVVVTTLNSPHLPLVRYAVGDLARRSDVICGCALGTEWSTLHLEGRARDCLATTRGALVTTRAVDDALAALPLWFWRVEQQSASRYALQAVVDDDKGWETLQAAKDALVVVFGADADVTVERVTRFSPERSLKFRQTVSATGSPWSTR